MTLKMVIRIIGQLICIIVFVGCTISRIDFDAKLNSTIGSPLPTTWYNQSNDPRLKKIVNENLNVVIYEHRIDGPVKCAWTVDVDKKTNLVLSWKYVSQEAADSCHDLAAGPKP
jgi:hypothetical protein